MPQPHSARHVAALVLNQVDAGGAYANLELDKQLRRAHLDERERALATELVYGVLRWQGQLDYCISRASNRSPEQIGPMVRNILRLTVYQLFHLTHIPAHAAVNEAVALSRTVGQPAASGFVNAVARRLAREGMPPFHLDANNAQDLSRAWSHPAWLINRWLANYGLAATHRILRTNQQPAHLTVRVNTLRVSRDRFLAEMSRAGVSAQAGLLPDAVLVEGGVAAVQLPGYAEGWFVVQDQSSQMVAYALAAQPGERVIDLCSAPGGKATHIAQLMGDQGEVVALELHSHRARLVSETAARLGIRNIKVIQSDSRRVPPEWQGRFDRVLLDAPCMGTGVLRRRVDLRWRLQAEDLTALTQLQAELLAAAAALLRPGGTLVYSTCSIEPEENRAQVAAFLGSRPQYSRGSLTHLQKCAPGLLAPAAHPELTEGELQLLPAHAHDGFFLSIIKHMPSQT